MVGMNFLGLFHPLGRKKEHVAPRFPARSIFSAQVRAIADLPVPAGPVIMKACFSDAHPPLAQLAMLRIYSSRAPGWQPRVSRAYESWIASCPEVNISDTVNEAAL
jgi:hypothetical protein